MNISTSRKSSRHNEQAAGLTLPNNDYLVSLCFTISRRVNCDVGLSDVEWIYLHVYKLPTSVTLFFASYHFLLPNLWHAFILVNLKCGHVIFLHKSRVTVIWNKLQLLLQLMSDFKFKLDSLFRSRLDKICLNAFRNVVDILIFQLLACIIVLLREIHSGLHLCFQN